MSNIDVAPQAAPAPVANEVPVDTSPISSPQPIGSQAPEKSPAEHRREAIQKAFDRANTPPEKRDRPAQRAEPKAAEAKPGHNQPPEETEKFDLKKRPNDQPRDRGRFAPRQPDENVAAKNEAQRIAQPGEPQGQPRHAYQALPEGTPYRQPPPRMAEHAKAVWHATPEPIRGEIGRMHAEFGQAYQQYRGDHETMNSIRPFHQMAAQHGTTLNRALTNYVSMEQKLRADPVGGLDVIVNNLNLKTPQGQPITLRDIAYHILSQTPDQHKVLQTQNAQNAQSQQIGALHQTVNALAQGYQQMQYRQQFGQIRGGIDRYAETHPRFDELGELIKNEILLGFDLDTAYRRAERLKPATQAAQTRTPSAQTRQTTDKSIYGAPSSPSANGASRRSDKPVGRREAIQRAISRVNGSL